MDLSVIIVNYNVRQFLENALFSLKQGIGTFNAEIIVVDNASDDGSVEMVRAKFPEVRLIESRENVGFARANNMALKEAKGDFLLLLNPDTVLQEDTLPVMIGFMRVHPDAGIAGCKIMNPDGTFQLSCRRSFPTPWVSFTKVFGLSSMFPGSRLFGRYNLTYLNADETYPVDAVSGSFMMISRLAYQEVGGLDESFFMYGEDLDYCYRIQQSGLKVYYLHSTQIIHYKGESTQRSNIDEIRVFYEAMRIFVRKHFGHSYLLRMFLSIGISLRAAAAFLARAGRPLSVAVMDFVLATLAMILGEYLRLGELFSLPPYAYPAFWVVPPVIVVSALFFSGAYTSNRYSVSRSGFAVLLSFLVISATVFFVKDFGFSRVIVGFAGFISLVLIPGWRLLFRLIAGIGAHGRSGGALFGRRTVIVGTGPSAQTVLRKLRARVDDGYEVMGLISTTRREVGEIVSGIKVIGSIENIGKVMKDRKVTEVIFSTDGLSFKEILSVIGKSGSRGVNFRLVPNSLEAIIGKASIDELDPIPMVEIEYNIHKSSNRLVKRLFDVFLSTLLLIILSPLFFIHAVPGSGRNRGWVRRLPEVLIGKISFVGMPLESAKPAPDPRLSLNGQASSLGPYGLTGLVQVQQDRQRLENDEVERLNLYYAKNQSLSLDLEILLKSVLKGRRTYYE